LNPVTPTTLGDERVRLEPLGMQHERLGARRDGVLRHHHPRRDGTVRDTVMYSLTVGEWPEVKAHLRWQLTRPR